MAQSREAFAEELEGEDSRVVRLENQFLELNRFLGMPIEVLIRRFWPCLKD